MEGNQWVIGYYGLGSPQYSIMFLDFNDDAVQIHWKYDFVMSIWETQGNICDANGFPLIWTNGMQIMGSAGTMIADTIAYAPGPLYWDYFYSEDYKRPYGFPQHSGALILPVPESQSEYSVIYHSMEPHPLYLFRVSRILEARVRDDPEEGLVLLYKDKLIGARHQWYTGRIIASRHANGRDWWVIDFEDNSPRYFSFLLDPSGLYLHHTGEVDQVVKEGLGQAVFSQQGNYIARMDAVTLDEGQYITVYAFDRCRGDIARLVTIHMQAHLNTGVAFSPSERYLYGDNREELWQWDLWADDIAASKTLVDTFDGFVQPGWFPMRFGPMAQGPDGRIYVIPPAGSSEFMHVIDRPDLPAAECRFLQHHINLMVPNARTAPNLPNFRLGPLDGSPCDTLGIDNIPVARWRCEEDTPDDPFTIRFTDLSYFGPEQWLWEFDDGSTSTTQHPVHSYSAGGAYHVCLTVSNTHATDSACKWVYIMPTSVEDVTEKVPDLSIGPNPFGDEIQVFSRSGHLRTAHMAIYDMHGRAVFNEPRTPVPLRIQLPRLAPGVYLCVVREQDGTEYSWKLMKL